MTDDVERVAKVVVHKCVRIHRELGLGLLESVYETVLAGALERAGLRVDGQVPIDIHYDGMKFTGAFSSRFADRRYLGS